MHGLKAHRESILAENHQIYVTSYATFRQDSEIYRNLSFDFLFLDEAQVMKNAQTKIAQSLRRLWFHLSLHYQEHRLKTIWENSGRFFRLSYQPLTC